MICSGIPGLAGQTDTLLVDKNNAFQAAFDLNVAAAADASKSQKYFDSLSGSGSVELKDSLARTVHKYVKTTTQVTQDFWQQQQEFAQAMCIYQTLLKADYLDKYGRDSVQKLMLGYLQSKNTYEANAKKKLQN
jgi:hypothetical protein